MTLVAEGLNKSKNNVVLLQTILHGIRKEDCVAHTISGTLYMEDSQSLLFITNCVLQFHSTSKITKQMLDRFPATLLRNQR